MPRQIKEERMRKIVVFMSVTLDGVVQAPARPDEDRRGGFEHGGWAGPYADPEMGKAAAESMGATDGILLGRRTYEDFYAVWPHRTDNPYTDVLNNTQKYVASTTLKEPLPWMNSTLLKGDAVDAVARLKKGPGKDIVVLGSGQLVQSLMRGRLIDQYVLLIHPVILGSGRRLFSDSGSREALKLVDTKTTSTGVIIATYQPAETSLRSSE
jgi:dihydrofolate reductase